MRGKEIRPAPLPWQSACRSAASGRVCAAIRVVPRFEQTVPEVERLLGLFAESGLAGRLARTRTLPLTPILLDLQEAFMKTVKLIDQTLTVAAKGREDALTFKESWRWRGASTG